MKPLRDLRKSIKGTTVLLAEDHNVVREGLRALLDAERNIQVIGQAKNGREAVELARQLHPAVVIMDISMPIMNGLEATRQILQIRPDTKIVVLSAHTDEEYVNQVLALGATGYLIKDTSGEILAQAIMDVQNGKTVLSPAIAKRLEVKNRKFLNRRGVLKTVNLNLSSREMEVLQLVAEGRANKQIAGILGISIKTVEKHRQSVMNKLNVHDTAGLTRYAIETGIIECEIHVFAD